MKIPLFDPRDIPSHKLSELDASDEPALVCTRETIQHALALLNSSDSAIAHELLKIAFLRQDVQHVEPARPAAVLIVLIESENELRVVLTMRAKHLRHHAGQISFVGGRVEQNETPLQAALREANEEIGLNTHELELLGELPVYHTITGFAVTPIVACISESAWLSQPLIIDPQEVDHLLTVPLSVLLDHDTIHVHDYEWENNRRQYYSVTHDEYFIWGASMAMLRNLDLLLRAI